MKNEINLLPPAVARLRARYLLLTRTLHLLNRLILFLLLNLVVVGSAIGVAIIQKEFWLPKGMSSDQASAVSTAVQEENRFLSDVHAWTQEQQGWSQLLPEIILVLPPGVKIKSLQTSGKSKALTVGGVAPSRRAVLEYQQKLEGLKWLKSLEAPFSNYASGEQVKFKFTLERKDEPK